MSDVERSEGKHKLHDEIDNLSAKEKDALLAILQQDEMKEWVAQLATPGIFISYPDGRCKTHMKSSFKNDFEFAGFVWSIFGTSENPIAQRLLAQFSKGKGK